MAKLRPAGKKKKKESNLKALPCLFLVVMAILLLTLLFYAMLSSSVQ